MALTRKSTQKLLVMLVTFRVSGSGCLDIVQNKAFSPFDGFPKKLSGRAENCVEEFIDTVVANLQNQNIRKSMVELVNSVEKLRNSKAEATQRQSYKSQWRS